MKIVDSAVTFTIAAICLCLGSGPAFAGMYAYIPNTGSNSIAVLDFDTDEITAEIAVEDSPQAVAVTSDGQYVFVANSNSGTVSVIQTSHISTSQDDVICTVNIGGELGGMALDRDNKALWVVSSSTNKAAKLDLSDMDNIQTTTISVGDNPRGVAVFRDGETVFVTNADDDTVTVISNGGASTIDVGDSPGGIVAGRYNDYVYVANEGDGAISVIDGEELEVVKTITVGSGPCALALASWGSYLYAANQADGTVSIINAVTFSVLEEGVAVGSSPSGLSVPLNGSDAYVTDSTDNTLSIVDLDGNVTTMDNAYLNTSNIVDLNGPMGLGCFIGGDAPDAPDDLTVSNVGETSFKITWNDNSNTEDGFKLEIKQEAQDEAEYKIWALIDESEESYWVTGLNDGITYNVRLAAYTEGADSGFSTSASASTDESEDDDDDDSNNDCFIGSLFH